MSRFEFNEAKVKARLNSQTKRARRLLKSEIVKDTEKFVPMQSGYLKNSITNSIQNDDDFIIYNTPYSRFLYYGYVMIGKITHRPWARRGETKVKTDKRLNFGKVHPCLLYTSPPGMVPEQGLEDGIADIASFHTLKDYLICHLSITAVLKTMPDMNLTRNSVTTNERSVNGSAGRP